MKESNSVAGSRIRQLRKHLRLSQKEFGDTLGLSAAGISRLEAGAYAMTDSVRKLIAQSYEVSEEWLLGESEEMKASQVSLPPQCCQAELNQFKVDLLNFISGATDEEWLIIKRFVEFVEFKTRH